MEINDLIKCDMDKPYAFISYSSEDKELVWADVLEYQKRGYNVWLDDKNVDKLKSSWKEDALEAIVDMDCKLVVFYVSKNSLTSIPCFNEMKATRADKTKKLHHGKQVPFIAVNVEEIGDILEFKNQTIDNIEKMENIQKSEKQNKILTISDFIEDFFNGNNEKVRIHCKSSRNASEYYQEITEYFDKKEVAKSTQGAGQRAENVLLKETPKRTSSFEGAESLKAIGASWFVSYAYYDKIDKSHQNWAKVSTTSNRISTYKNSVQYHKNWLAEIQNMNPQNLNRNSIGLTAEDAVRMATEILNL